VRATVATDDRAVYRTDGNALFESFFITACSMDEYDELKKTKHNLIVRSGKSKAKVTNNKNSAQGIVQTRSIARPVCDSRGTCIGLPAFVV